jgi:hypothetical protein
VDFPLVPSTKTSIISPLPEPGAISARRAAASDRAVYVNSRAADEQDLAAFDRLLTDKRSPRILFDFKEQ